MVEKTTHSIPVCGGFGSLGREGRQWELTSKPTGKTYSQTIIIVCVLLCVEWEELEQAEGKKGAVGEETSQT